MPDIERSGNPRLDPHDDRYSPTLERAVEAEAEVKRLRALLAELIDPNPCQYDHNDACQEHHLAERPCPHERAKALGINAR